MKAPSPSGEIVLYRAPDGGPALDVRLERDTIWLDTRQMAALFARDRTVILRHIRNIYATRELDRKSTCAKNAQVAADGKLRRMDLYNLDMAISAGYRVNSKRGTQFRSWATRALREHLVRERSDQLGAILGNIEQMFGREPLLMRQIHIHRQRQCRVKLNAVEYGGV